MFKKSNIIKRYIDTSLKVAIMNFQSLVEQYKFIRDEIKHEYKLISDRKSSLMVPQAFLFTALAIGIPKSNYPELINSVYYPLIPVIALLLLIIPQLGICAALRRIEFWKKEQRRIENEMKNLNLTCEENSFCIQEKQTIVHFLGKITSLFISPIFLFSWLYILEVKLLYIILSSIFYTIFICLVALPVYFKKSKINS